MSTNFMSLHRPGIGNASSYQVSGIPFLTGSVTAPISSSTPLEISFPQVTKRIIVTNISSQDLRLGFSANGVKGTNYVLVHPHGGGTPSEYGKIELEVKSTSVFLLSHTGTPATFCLAAELTNIPSLEIVNNWSGSAGIG